ncbi:MAG: hypothetical protein WCT04_24890 [Planctomycetota bacterium]
MLRMCVVVSVCVYTCRVAIGQKLLKWCQQFAVAGTVVVDDLQAYRPILTDGQNDFALAFHGTSFKNIWIDY